MMSMKDVSMSQEELAEQLISTFPKGPRAKSVSTQLRNYVAALQVKPPEDDGIRMLDMSMPRPSQLRPPKGPRELLPVDNTGRLPLLPMNRRKARELYGFTLQEVAMAAKTTITTAKIYEEHRSSIRRNDKRKALDDVYRMFVLPTVENGA